MTMHDIAATEAVVADGNAQPDDELRHAGQIQQPDIDGLRAVERGKQAQAGDQRAADQGHQRHAVLGQPGEDARRIALGRHVVEHARGRIHAGVAGRQHRGQDHRIHHRGRRQQARVLEHQRERAHGDIGHIGAQQLRIGIGNQKADDDNRQHIEQQDAPEHLTNRARHVLARILGFARRHAHQLRALEGIGNDHGHAHKGREIADEWRIARGPVLEARYMAVADDAEQNQHAGDQKGHHGQHLDQREPVLGLGKTARGKRVQPHHQQQEQAAPDDAWHIGKPVGHDQLRGHQVHRHHHGPAEPEVPAQRKAEAAIHIARGIGREGTGHRHEGSQLAQAGHDVVHHDADEQIGEHGTAGADLGDGRAGGHEQARSDGAANGDHAQVALLEHPVQAGLLIVTIASRRELLA